MVEFTESDRPRSLSTWLSIALLLKPVTVKKDGVWDLETAGSFLALDAKGCLLLDALGRRTKDTEANPEQLGSLESPLVSTLRSR